MSLDFVSLDFETANESRSSACAIGLVEVTNGVSTRVMSRLFRPPAGFDDFSGWNIAIHGITPQMVADEPRFADLWPEVLDFIGDRPIVAHNASFDLSVLRATLNASDLEWPELSYACTMVMSRALFDLTSHGLSYVAHKAGIPWNEEKHHDALYDAQACANITLAMAKIKGQSDLFGLLGCLSLTEGRLLAGGWETCRSTHHRADSLDQTRVKMSAREIHVNIDAKRTHPLFGKHITFTGGLHSMSRTDAWFEVARIGAIPGESVTKQTNVIVVGQKEVSKFKPGETSSEKFRKAEKLRALGQDIEVIDERDFLAYIEPTEGVRS